MSTLQAIILSVVEGITEFLPISSTGHMIIGSSMMGIAHDEFVKVFTVSIQFGAILSVIALYWRRFFQSFDFYLKLFIAFLPAAIIGKLFNSLIDALLGDVLVVAVTLVAGGIVFLFIDSWVGQSQDRVTRESVSGPPQAEQNTFEVAGPDPEALGPELNVPMTNLSAFKIGLFQCLAMIPGVSRSAATIIGGLLQGLTRQQAAEFSFFLAVPTMLAATLYKIYSFRKAGFVLTTSHIHLLLIGNIAAFLVAMAAIRTFIGYLTQHGFRLFGYYRIAIGLAILIIDLIAPGWLHL